MTVVFRRPPKLCLLVLVSTALSDRVSSQQQADFHCSSHADTDYEAAGGNATVLAYLRPGAVRGKVFVNPATGFRAQVYRGIPYATQRRFERAEPVRRFAEDPLDATRPPPICVQFNAIAEHVESIGFGGRQAEDCLFISVAAPYRKSEGLSVPGRPYPVLVWVHGGAFELGAADAQGFDGVIDNFVARGTVFVTVSYRLGPLGFLNLPPAPRNLGLYDIDTAVDFIIDNVRMFGGDPRRVTLIGESAGAKAVSLVHSYNPAPRVSGSIVMSGPQAADLETDLVSASAQLAALSGCDVQTADALVCLKGIEVARLKGIVARIKPADPHLQAPIKWGPAVDGRMVTANSTQALLRRRGSLMIGTTSDEWAIFMAMTIGAHKRLGKRVDYDWLNNSMAAVINAQEGIKDKALATRLALHQYYDTVASSEHNASHIYRALGEFSADVYFNAPTAKEARLSAPNNFVWLYQFDILRPALYPVYLAHYDLWGPPHTADLAYIFGTTAAGAGLSADYRFDEIDCAVIDKFTGAMVDFAANGDPRGPNGWPRWPPVSRSQPDVYLNIGERATVERGYERQAAALWNGLVPSAGCAQ